MAGGTRFAAGARVGVPWLGWTCGECEYCTSGRENLCAEARFTGYTLDGGYAEYALADERFCFALPERYGDAEAAPLLCAGLIGYRSYAFAGEARTLGLYGFGAAAHILAQVAKAQGRKVFAFTRPGDEDGEGIRPLRCGADWAGGSDEAPPEPLDAAIIFAPVGALVPQALAAVKKGGRVVCGGIHMSDIPSFPYALLWGERARAVGRQPDARRRRGVHARRRRNADPHRDEDLSARAGERGARRAARRKARRRGGASALALSVAPALRQFDVGQTGPRQSDFRMLPGRHSRENRLTCKPKTRTTTRSCASSRS